MSAWVPPRDWSSGITVIAASGPSLTAEQLEYARGRAARILVINNAHELAPWADAIYACDADWWDHYGPTVAIAERWTQCPDQHHATLHARQRATAAKWDLHLAPSQPGKGLGAGIVHWGSNGGHQAINLAALFGARKIVLLGYDFQATGGRSHFHGDHPGRLNKPNHYEGWMKAMEDMAADLLRAGVSVFNASPETALACFPQVPLAEALK